MDLLYTKKPVIALVNDGEIKCAYFISFWHAVNYTISVFVIYVNLGLR